MNMSSERSATRSYAWRVALLSCLLLLGCVGISAAQDDEYVAEEDETLAGPSEADYAIIDELLARDEASLTNTDTSAYDPGTRRDPFRSLLQRRKSALTEVEQERPEGPAGLLIDEIEIEGVFVLPDGPVVQIQSASEETSFLLRPGDQLWDGDVVSISLDEVTFKQSINDPSSLKPYREIVKRMKQ